MRYFIGALIGICLVLLFFGVTIYYQYSESDRSQQTKREESQLKQKRYSNDKSSANSPSVQPRIQKQPEPVSVNTKPNLYTWEDKDGNTVISEWPPATGQYEKLVLPEQGLSVIEMEKVKPIKRKRTKQKSQYTSRPSGPAAIKQQLISKNTGSCRWLVGRSYELYTNIQEHTGTNRSIYCDEHSKRVIEMHQLGREGNSCYYPYRNPAKC